MKFIPITQGSDEWLRFRRSHIGASDAVTIMGLSPWKSPLELYEEKIFQFEQEENQYMKRGKDLEEAARQAFEEQIGISVFPMVFQSDVYNWMAASMDGITMDHKVAVEIKVPGKTDLRKASEGIISPKYVPQLQHQMYVCELDKIYYFCYSENVSFCLEVKRDDEYIAKLIEKEKEFWHCLTTLKPPS
jgi:putative phage-type endonuclease